MLVEVDNKGVPCSARQIIWKTEQGFYLRAVPEHARTSEDVRTLIDKAGLKTPTFEAFYSNEQERPWMMEMTQPFHGRNELDHWQAVTLRPSSVSSATERHKERYTHSLRRVWRGGKEAGTMGTYGSQSDPA
jgi:hypothetical protein